MKLTEKQIRGWIDRNDWRGGEKEAETAIEDARSLHLLRDESFIDPLGTREDFENDVKEAQNAYDANPSGKNFYDLQAAKAALRRRWPNSDQPDILRPDQKKR